MLGNSDVWNCCKNTKHGYIWAIRRQLGNERGRQGVIQQLPGHNFAIFRPPHIPGVPSHGQFLYPERGQTQIFFNPLPPSPSSCSHSYWMATNRIIKQMKEELAMKDFQLESMKTKIEAIKKRNRIYVNRRQILTNT